MEVLTKKCSKCGIEKPATSEYFNKAKRGYLGLRAQCKACQKKYREENAEKVNAGRQRWNDAHPDYHKEYYVKNSEQLKKRNMERYYANHKENLAKHKEYRERPGQKERQAALNRNWREKNKNLLPSLRHEYYEKNKEAIKARVRGFYSSEYGKPFKQLNDQKRRSLKKQSISTLTMADWRDALEFFEHKCAYCGEPDEVLHQDHVIALSKGGHYTRQNIIPACSTCNFRKHNSDLFAWYPKQDFFDPKRLKKIQQWTGYTECFQQMALF